MFDTEQQIESAADWDDPAFLEKLVATWSDELAELPEAGVVLRLREQIRALSAVQAQVYEEMAAVVDACEAEVDDTELAWDAASSEIRAALRLTRRSADAELDLAVTLRDRLPQVLAALRFGDIDRSRARVLVEGVSHLPDDTARAVIDEIIGDAGTLTTGQLRERLRRLCLDLDPDDATERMHEAIDRRHMTTEPTVDGTAHLSIRDISPDRAVQAARHVDRIARSLRRGDETRSMDQLRADVAVDLLCGATPEGSNTSPSQAGINLTVELTTLAELDDHPGHLAGYGPIVADLARHIAATNSDGHWTHTITDRGRPVDTGVVRRRPTASQQRAVAALHPTCVFPGCRMPAADCDIDHRTAHVDHGPTETDNLAPLCRHDHRLKHEAGWSLDKLADGNHLWTSPLGHTYTTGRDP